MTFLAYRGTLQERALGLVAAKVKAALIVEGELPADGLAGLDADDHDQVVALARRLVDPAAADDASLEAMFAETRTLEAAAEEVLDEAQRLGPEPEPDPVLLAMAVSSCDAAPLAATADLASAPLARAIAQLPLVPRAAPSPAARPGEGDGAGPTLPPPVGQVVRFADLAPLARPRARRRKAVPVSQLGLFSS